MIAPQTHLDLSHCANSGIVLLKATVNEKAGKKHQQTHNEENGI